MPVHTYQRPPDPRFTNGGLDLDLPYWRTLPDWSMAEAILVLSGQSGAGMLLASKHGTLADTLRIHFPHVRDRFRRAVEIGDITDPARPADWLALAQRLGMQIPTALDAGAPPIVIPAVSPEGRPPGRRGRKPGSGAIDDDAALDEMRRLIADGEAPSLYDAAGKAAGLTRGQSREATQRRLAKKYRELSLERARRTLNAN